MIIMGIDPGLASTGFGAILCNGRKLTLIRCGYIKTFPGNPVADRLFQIYTDMEMLMDAVKPDLIAVENVFSLVRYPKAGILLGGVLGVLYLAAKKNGVALSEISPKEAKNALVGFGSADKKQIKSAVQKMLGIEDLKSFHAADALAVAIAAFYRNVIGSKRDILP